MSRYSSTCCQPHDRHYPQFYILVGHRYQVKGVMGRQTGNYIHLCYHSQSQYVISARVSSKDAYMLVYARSEGLEDSSSSENYSPIRDAVPPPRALEVVNALNAEHDKACDEYAAK